MSPQLLQALLLLIGAIGAIGVGLCIILLRHTALDERAYAAEPPGTVNGRELMVINTDKRRYGINLVMFVAAILIYAVSSHMPIGVERSTVNSILVVFFFVAAFINLALDAKDSRDLLVHGVLSSTQKDKQRDDLRDTSRDEGRDPTRDAHRDVARDAEHDKEKEDGRSQT